MRRRPSNWSIVRTGTTSAHKSLFFNLRRMKKNLDAYDAVPDAYAALALREQVQFQAIPGLQVDDQPVAVAA